MEDKFFKNQSKMEIKDIFFIEQVFIWGLRMKVRGDQYFAKVVGHCEKNLSPSAARIALSSIDMVINSVRNHGKRSLKLNCTCMPRLSSDEWLLITLFRAANDEPFQATIPCATDIITEEGNASLVHAMISFQMAMETIDSPYPKGLNNDLAEQHTEHDLPRPTSTMIH